MGWIRVETSPGPKEPAPSEAEGDLTSARCFVAREAVRTDITKEKQMTATVERLPAGAPSNRPVDWNSIDWKAARRQVNRLQSLP